MNVVIALLKIIDLILLRQIMQNIKENNLIKHQHHGAIKHKLTQTLVMDLHNAIMEQMKNNKE